MKVKHFFDEDTFTLTYIVYDPQTKDAVVIDPVWNLDMASGGLTTRSVNEVIRFAEEEKLNLLLSIETHIHADHLSGFQLLKNHYPQIKSGVSSNIKSVQKKFSPIFNIDIKTNGEQFDYLYEDGQTVKIGSLEFKFIATPGHTPACSSLLFGNKLFTGDAIFMPDYGTGRCDFPMGSAKDLYHSIKYKIYSLPDDVEVYVGHDYLPDGREMKFLTTVGEQKKSNIHLDGDTSEKDFVEMREARDKTLRAPKLLLPSIQVNVDGGKLPQPEDNNTSYLKIPLNR